MKLRAQLGADLTLREQLVTLVGFERRRSRGLRCTVAGPFTCARPPQISTLTPISTTPTTMATRTGFFGRVSDTRRTLPSPRAVSGNGLPGP